MHILNHNDTFLKLFQKQINVLIEDENYKDGECFYFYSLYPNNNGETPLDIAVRDQSTNSVDSMFDMLC